MRINKKVIKIKNPETGEWEAIPAIQGEKGADGKDGKDGLTTSIKLNGETYTQNNGIIELPDISGDYNDLTNKPEIPSIEGLATEEFVNNLNNDVVENINEINTELETKASREFVNTTLDGLRLVQITKEDYDALETKDPSTLYIVI